MPDAYLWSHVYCSRCNWNWWATRHNVQLHRFPGNVRSRTLHHVGKTCIKVRTWDSVPDSGEDLPRWKLPYTTCWSVIFGCCDLPRWKLPYTTCWSIIFGCCDLPRWKLPYTTCWSIIFGCCNLLKLPGSINCTVLYFLKPTNTHSGHLSCRCTKWWLQF